MLIYSKERYVPTDVNMMVIRAKDNDGFFYIHRLLYDQAVIINDIYEDLPTLLKAVTNSEESRGDVDYFYENAPSPINVLGAFLKLVTEELTDFIDMVGAIHVISGPINMRGMLRVPYEMRNNNYKFSLSIKEEYQLAWDRFFQTVLPYDTDMFLSRQGATPMNGVMTSTVTEEEEPQEETGYEEFGIDADVLAFLTSDEDPFAMDDEEEEDEAAVTSPVPSTTPTPTPAPVVQPTVQMQPEPEPEPEPEQDKEKNLVDGLLGL